VLGEFSWEKEPHSGLNFPAGDGGLLVVVSEAGGFDGDSLEDVIHERVHDAHRFAGDSSVRVDLLQHLVDVDGVGFLPALLPFLAVSGSHLGLSTSLLFSFLGSADLFSGHDSFFSQSKLERYDVQQTGNSFYIKSIGSMKTDQSFWRAKNFG